MLILIKKRGLFVPFLFAFLTTILVVATSFFNVSAAPDPDGGVAPVKTYTIEEKATRWTYYRALSYCIIKSPIDTNITTENLNAGKIFAQGGGVSLPGSWAVPIGNFFGELPESGWADADYDDSMMYCSSGGWVKNAFVSLGFSSINDAALSLGFVKEDKYSDGVMYWDLPDGGPRSKIDITKFRGLVAYYGNPELTYDDAVQYYQELRVFSAGCIGKTYPSYLTTDPLTEANRDSLEDKYEYNIKHYSAEERKLYEDDIYEGIRDHDRKIWYRINIDGDSADNVQDKCINILNSINSRIDDYKKAVDDALKSGSDANTASGNPGDPAVVTGSTATCGSKVTGIGWIVCPVINAMATMTDGMWKFVDNLLFVNPISDSSGGVYDGWKKIRDIANVMFVIAFLIIIFSQLTGVGITNYGVKKMLPRVVIVAIAVNLSFILMQLAVDVTNIVGKGLYDAVTNSTTLPDNINWAYLIEIIIKSNVAAAGGLVIGASALVVLGPEAALLALVPILLSVMVAFLAAVITLIFRQAAIPILAMVAPLAFVAYLLPNTEQWFKKWYKLLLNMLMLYPMAALVFAGARFAGNVIISDALVHEESFMILVGLVVIGLPMFSLPFISRQGAPMLAKVNGALGSLGKRITSPIDNFSKEVAKNARVRSDNAAMNAEKPGIFRSARRGVLRYRAGRNAVNQTQEKELNRSQTDYVAGEVLNENSKLAQQMAKGGGSGADSRAQASAIKAQDDIHRQERDAETILLRNKDMATILRQAQGGAGITEAQQDAAMDHVMRNGDLGQRMEAISALTTSASERVRATAADGFFARKDHQVFGAPLGETIRAGGDGTKSVRQAVTDALGKKVSEGNLSAAALASDERVVDEILGNAEKGITSRLLGELSEDAIDNLARQARVALESPNTSETLNAEYRAKLQAIADRASKLPS